MYTKIAFWQMFLSGSDLDKFEFVKVLKVEQYRVYQDITRF